MIHDSVRDFPVDICKLLASFVMDRCENNEFMLSLSLQHEGLSAANNRVDHELLEEENFGDYDCITPSVTYDAI